jgi:hypothetical protein
MELSRGMGLFDSIRSVLGLRRKPSEAVDLDQLDPLDVEIDVDELVPLSSRDQLDPLDPLAMEDLDDIEVLEADEPDQLDLEQLDGDGGIDFLDVDPDVDFLDVEPDASGTHVGQNLSGSFDTTTYDSGSFDFEHDIGRYFTAEFRIETATHDPIRRTNLLAEYEVQNFEHWQRIQAAFERWLETPAAKAKYRTMGDLMQARMSTTQTMTLADLGLDRVRLDPIGGVSLEQWAKVEGAVQGGGKLRRLIAELGIDLKTWNQIAAAWHERMEADTSGRIGTEYMLHFGR